MSAGDVFFLGVVYTRSIPTVRKVQVNPCELQTSLVYIANPRPANQNNNNKKYSYIGQGGFEHIREPRQASNL